MDVLIAKRASYGLQQPDREKDEYMQTEYGMTDCELVRSTGCTATVADITEATVTVRPVVGFLLGLVFPAATLGPSAARAASDNGCLSADFSTFHQI
jgi:hypothetical protein